MAEHRMTSIRERGGRAKVGCRGVIERIGRRARGQSARSRCTRRQNAQVRENNGGKKTGTGIASGPRLVFRLRRPVAATLRITAVAAETSLANVTFTTPLTFSSD